MWGGAYNPMQLSLQQGQQYDSAHSNQHGGSMGNYSGAGAPVGDQGLLPRELVDSSRTGSLDMKIAEIGGMRDPDQLPVAPQAGGRRRRSCRKGSRKNRKGSRKNRKGSRKGSRKNRKGSRKGSRRNLSGGGLDGSPLSAPNMLLSASQAAKAGTADFSNPWMRN